MAYNILLFRLFINFSCLRIILKRGNITKYWKIVMIKIHNYLISSKNILRHKFKLIKLCEEANYCDVTTQTSISVNAPSKLKSSAPTRRTAKLANISYSNHLFWIISSQFFKLFWIVWAIKPFDDLSKVTKEECLLLWKVRI